MLKRTLLAVTFGLGICASVASAQTATPPAPDMTINQRLENQQDRTKAGTADGQLTKAERTKVRADDAGIRAQARVDRQANGGKLTGGEKQQLNRELNRNSRQIYRERHNNKTPKA